MVMNRYVSNYDIKDFSLTKQNKEIISRHSFVKYEELLVKIFYFFCHEIFILQNFDFLKFRHNFKLVLKIKTSYVIN